MSVADVRSLVRDAGDTSGAVRARLVAALFGDRLGLAIFLGCVCLFATVWRTSVLINDTYTLVNGLYSLSNGHLAMTEAAYGPTLDTPGTTTIGGDTFARNYGAIVLSIPFWLLLEGLGTVVDLRIGLVGLWSLGLLAFVVTVGRLLEDERFTVVGSIVVLGLFLLNVALATPLDGDSTHLYALQLFHLTVAAVGPVLLYRLVRRLESRQLGIVSAVLVTLGTPLALWATIPKRHVLTATVVLGVAYCLYRSRTATDGPLVQEPRTFRALGYALVGLYAWVHAPEALLVLLVLAIVDVPTAPENNPRTLALIAAALGLSLIPFFVTNTLIADSPLRPPRLLGSSAGAVETPLNVEASGSGTIETEGDGSGERVYAGLPPLIGAIDTLESILLPVLILVRELIDGVALIIDQPATLYHAMIRSGHTTGTVNLTGEEAVNLSLLESAPLVVSVLAGVRGLKSIFDNQGSLSRKLPGRYVVDLFAICMVVGITLLYASRLPVHAQITVRYWFPIFPLGTYLVVRIPVVRHTLTACWKTFAWTLAGSVFVGGQLVVVVVFLTANGIGEAFQFHALLSLAIAVPLGLWAVLGQSDGVSGRIGAVLLGVATSAPILFVLLVMLDYYPLGDTHALPIVRWVAEVLTLL